MLLPLPPRRFFITTADTPWLNGKHGASRPPRRRARLHARTALLGIPQQQHACCCCCPSSRAVVFGRVVDGLDVVDRLQNVAADRGGRPAQRVVIEDCGLLT